MIEVIVNNHVLGMVRQWQDSVLRQNAIQSTVLDDGVDYVKMAEAMGATGFRATNTRGHLHEVFARSTGYEDAGSDRLCDQLR